MNREDTLFIVVTMATLLFVDTVLHQTYSFERWGSGNCLLLAVAYRILIVIRERQP